MRIILNQTGGAGTTNGQTLFIGNSKRQKERASMRKITETFSLHDVGTRLLAGFLAACVWQTPQTAQAADLGNVMPMGDSITLGSNVTGGYRDPLYTLLTNRADTFTFVGSLTGSATAALTAAGQAHHEGHSGYVITNGASRTGLDENLAGWIGPGHENPDKILLMIGSNDINLSYDMPNAPTRLSNLITHIYGYRPNVRLYVASIIPMSAGGHQTDVQTFNAAIPGIVASHQALGRDVVYVPMYEALNISTDLADGLHPNALGYLHMAQAWDTALHTPPNLTVAVASPANNQTITVGSSITATAAVLNATGAYAVHVYTNSGSGAFAEAGTGGSSSPYAVSLGMLPTGTYHICASVTDMLATTNSVTNTFTVALAPPTFHAVDVTSAGDGPALGTSFSVGWDFTVSQAIRVTSLGQFDPDSNPKTNTVAIYQRGGAKLLEATVSSSSPAELSGIYYARYAAVGTLELPPGNYVVFSTQNGDNFIAGGGSPAATFGTAITWNKGVALASGSAAGPVPITAPATWPIENTSASRYFGPTFKYNLVSTTPIVALTSPANNQAFATSESVSATATVVNAMGAYAVHVYMNSGEGSYSEAGTGGSSSPYPVNLGTLSAGTYHIYASVTDTLTTTNTATNTFTVAVVGPDIWASGATANWSVGANWTAESANRPPTSKDSLVFGATTGTTSLTNDLTTSAFGVAGITFSAGAPAYTLSGNTFALSGDITNNSASAQTFNTPFSLTAERAVSTASGNITLGGIISGSGSGGIVKTGTGTLTLTKQNTYSNVTVNAGTLKLNHSGNNADTVRGTLTVNNGGTLSFGTYNQFGSSPSIPVVVNAGGAVDSSATVTTFRDLKLAGGNLLGKGGFGTAWGSFALFGTLSVTADSSIHHVSGVNNFITPGEFNNNQTLNINVSAGATLTENLPILNYVYAGPTKVYSITKSGTGTARFSGTNTYSGGTTLQAGTLSIAAYTNLPTVGALTFTGGILQVTGTALTSLNPYQVSWTSKGGGFDVVAGGNTLAVTNALGGGGGLLKLGAGALTLSGANTYSGDTTNSAGLLRLASPSAVSNSTVVMDGGACVFASSAGANVTFGGLANTPAGLGSEVALSNETGQAVSLTLGGKGSAMSYSGILSGSGSLTKIGDGMLSLSGTNTYSGGTRLNGGVLSVGDTNNLPVSGGLTFGGGTLQLTGTSLSNFDAYAVNWSTFDGGLDLTNATHALIVTNALAGTGRLTKLGAGTLTLAGANTHSGVTTNGGGVLVLADPAALSNSTLAMSGGRLAFAETVAAATLGGLAAVTSGAGYDVALTNGLGAAVPLTVGGNDASTTFAGVLSGSGSLTKIGGGALTLSGRNTYGGNTTNSAGLLALGHTNALGTGTLVLSGGALAASADLSGVPGVANPVVLRQDSLITNASNLRLSGLVSGTPNSLTKSGNGTVTLSGGITVSNVTVNGGTLTLARLPGNVSDTLLPKGTFTVNNGGTLTFAGYNQLRNATTTPPVVVNAGGVIDSGATVTTFRDLKLAGGNMRATGNFGPQWGTFVLFGTLNVTANASILNISGGINNAITPGAHQGNQTLAINVSENATLTNAVPLRNSATDTTSIPVIYSITKAGLGSAVFSAENTYGGKTTVSAGTLNLAHMYAVSNSTVVMNGGSVVFSSAVTGRAFTFGGLAAAGSGAGYDIGLTNEAGNAVTLTVGNNASNTVYAGVLSGSGSLVKVGTGTLTLAGANTYTGKTTVNGGTLVATNMAVLSASSEVTLALGTTLSFSSGGETFNGALTVNVSSNSASLLTVSGNLTLGAGSSLTVAPGSQFNRSRNYTVVTCTALSGSFGAVTGLPKGWLVRYTASRVELFYAEGTLLRLR
jgi:autotransporter-associated beta strand protein